MGELDLVPADYRKSLKLRQHLKLYLIIFALVVIAVIGGKATLSSHTGRLSATVTDFEQKKLLLEQKQQRLADMRTDRNFLLERVRVLRSLQNGPSAEVMFQVVDQAYVEGTWFKKFKFRQDGEIRGLEAADETDTGYFIIVRDSERQNREQAWRMNTHMEISGHALDHTVLAGFVNNLVTSEAIEDVKILKTGRERRNQGSAIGFDLAIRVSNTAGRERWSNRL